MGSGTFAENQYFFRHGSASLLNDINFMKNQGFVEIVLVKIFNSYSLFCQSLQIDKRLGD
jgi:hypothetical protein